MDSLTEEGKILSHDSAELLLLHGSGLIHDYLKEKEELKPFISDFPDWSGIARQIDRKANEQLPRELVHDVLIKQYAGLEQTTEVSANIEALKNQDCFCIVTAHQTNLFGGPMYWIYKALSAIKLAVDVKLKNPKIDCVPVFWLGSEDHDFDELNHIHLHGRTLDWTDNQGGAFGRYSTESLSTVIAELKVVLGKTKYALDIIAVVEQAYESTTMASATRSLLHRLFGHLGLVVIDGDDRELKKEMTAIYLEDLFENSSQQLIEPQVQALELIYGRSQAMVRDINLFYLSENSRERIVRRGDKLGVSNSAEEKDNETWRRELNEFPERFSPNVMLRPLMQEKLLPNLAYVGGGGELSYWFQLKPLFDHHKVAFPLLIRRDSALFLSKKNSKRLKKLELTVADFIGDVELLKKQYVKKHSEQTLQLADQLARMNAIFSEVSELAKSIDFTLGQSVESEKQKLSNSIRKLEKKMLRAEKRNFGEDLQRIDHIRSQIYPNGSFQERYMNYMQLYSLYGPQLFDHLLDQFDPLSNTIKVLIES